MDFFVPFDQIGVSSPGPWKNANPSAGQRGSILNALVFPAIQGEILAVQDEAGLTRSGTDFTQLLQALRSGKFQSFVDTGTADALVVTPLTNYSALALGTEITVRKSNAPNATATPTLTVGTFTKVISKEDGSGLTSGDLPAGALITFKYDGTSLFRVVGLRKSDLAPSSAFAQTLVNNYPSLSPPKNGRFLSGAGTVTLTIGGGGANDPPATVTDVLLTGVGGGGGGAAAGTSGGVSWSGGGGGSAGPVSSWFRGLTPGSTITLVKGAGGVGGTSGNGNTGGSGGSSTAVSGSYSLTSPGGGGGVGSTTTCAGGAPSTGSGSTIGYNLTGAPGGDGNPTNINVQGGAGATSIFGGGGRTSTLGSNHNAASNGLSAGSGGGGTWQISGTEVGGIGADGAWLVQW